MYLVDPNAVVKPLHVKRTSVPISPSASSLSGKNNLLASDQQTAVQSESIQQQQVRKPLLYNFV